MNVINEGFSEVERDFYEERAAIMEFDGGMSRENAETEAAKLTLLYLVKQNFFGGVKNVSNRCKGKI